MAANISSLSKGLVAHYPLNGEYETKDVTPNANHGTNNGATLSTGRKGEANGSYSFDGNIPNSIYLGRPEVQNFIPQVDEFSICSWYKSTSKGVIYSFGGSDLIRQIQLDFTENNFEMYLGQSAGSQNKINTALTPNYIDGNWHHVAIVIPAGSTGGKFYYDGNLVSSSLNIGSGTAVNPAYIGARTDGMGYPLWGSVSDLRIYDRQLTDSEIKLLYDSFKPEVSTTDLNKGLVGHWMLDSENGAKDLTPNGNHGTANGGITIGDTTDRKGKTGGATTFDGTNDYILLDSNFQITSVSMWINFWNVTKVAYFLGNSSESIGIRYDGYSFLAYSGSNNWAVLNWTKVNRMVHLGIVRVDNTAYYDFYIDGIKIGTAYAGDNNSDIIINTIGRRESQYYFNGSISDVCIYNRELSEDEIKLLYDQYKPKEASIGSLQKGLVLDMPLTTKHMKSATVVSDRTPYGNDGTVSGAIVGSEYTSFDGTDDYVNLGLNSEFAFGNNSFTYAVWARPVSKSNQYNYLISLGIADTGLGAGFGIRNSGALFLSGYSSPIVNTNYIIPILNYWYYFCVVYNGDIDKADFYVNGVFVEQESIILNIQGANAYIGALISNLSPFNGDISQVKIYNRALSAEEVKLLYEKGRY